MPLSLPPIIKIKRGSGTPPTWGITMGITAGEFAYDKTTRTLFLGITGGYTAYDGGSGLGTLIPNNQNNVVPVGMQISNDPTFGSGANKNVRAGYSDYTVPTTAAVKEYITFVKSNVSAGLTIFAGVGIGITYSELSDPDVSITINNQGVIKGFTAINIVGGLGDDVYAKSATSGLTLIASSGIELVGSNADESVRIRNIGVTGIAGVTGNITSYIPITTLSGYTSAFQNLLGKSILATSPIVVSKENDGQFDYVRISHTLASGGICFGTNSYDINNTINTPNLLSLKRDTEGGHITAIESVPLNFFNANSWSNFNESVQDAVFPAIRALTPSDRYGITGIYDDTNSQFNLVNRGITSIGIFGNNHPGLCGAAKLFGQNAISLGFNFNNNSIGISYTGLQFGSVSSQEIPTASQVQPIFVGGVSNNSTVSASVIGGVDTVNFRPGIGMGILATSYSANDKSIVFYNNGIHRVSAYNNNTLLGATGFTGDLKIYAGTGIQLSRNNNDLTISATSGGAGGAIVDFEADYGYTSGSPDYSTAYSGGGVTGLVDISGLNGLATSQTYGDSTKNGTVYVGLSSKVAIPADKHLPVNVGGGTGFGELSLPTSRLFPNSTHPGQFELPHVGLNDISGGDARINEYTRLMTDQVRAGLTGALSYGDNYPSWNPAYAAYPLINTNTTRAGGVLQLVSDAGELAFTSGFLPPPPEQFDPGLLADGKHAEIRLLGYPNAENMSSYIQQALLDGGISPATVCVDGNCIGYPPRLPVPDADTGSPNYSYLTNPEVLTNGTYVNTKPAVVIKGDVVAKNSMFVNSDIFLNGNIIDIKTGELYASPGGGNVFNGGNLGLTGDLIVGGPNGSGSIYVHGGTAFFNVDNLSTESGIIHIGGLSASSYSELYSGTLTTLDRNYNGDRGLFHTAYTSRARSALYATRYFAPGTRNGFVGIDASDGRFKYFFNANRDNTNGTVTVIPTSQLGSAQFGDINYVGMTADSAGIITFKAISDPDSTAIGVDPTVSTELIVQGKLNLTAPTAPSARPIINLGDNSSILLSGSSRLDLGSVLQSKVGFQNFPYGLTFESKSGFYHSSADVANATSNLRISWPQISASETSPRRSVIFRNLGDSAQTTVVDIGRYYAGNDPTVGTQWQDPAPSGQSSNGFEEAPLQILYNKQLANGTVIDCGSY